VQVKSRDNDALGVMFRYLDGDNYYRFSWDRDRKYRRLVKKVDGVFTLLAQDAVPYAVGRSYGLEITAEGDALEVSIDGAPVFSVTDGSVGAGGVGLYAWGNAGSVFDDLVVEELSGGGVFLADDFEDGDAAGWRVVDEGMRRSPSGWSVRDGAYEQRSNIMPSPTGGAYIEKPETYTFFSGE
jgi:hypothetical protein